MPILSRTLPWLSRPKVAPTPFQKTFNFVVNTLIFLLGWTGLLISVNRHWQALPVETRFPVMLFILLYPLPWLGYLVREKLEPYMMAFQTYMTLLIASQAVVGLLRVTS
jgi:hypothetical protein